MGVREFRGDEQPELVVVTDHLLVELDHYLILCVAENGTIEFYPRFVSPFLLKLYTLTYFHECSIENRIHHRVYSLADIFEQNRHAELERVFQHPDEIWLAKVDHLQRLSN